MRESLHSSAQNPLFQAALTVAVRNLIQGARTLTSIGLDVNVFIGQALESIHQQLNDAAYELTNLDELLEQARAIGDEIEQKTRAEEARPGRTPKISEADDSSGQGDIGKSD